MRVDCSIPAGQRTGVSVYYDDYKRKLAVDYSQIKPTSAFRRNKPHPSKVTHEFSIEFGVSISPRRALMSEWI